MTNTSQRQNTAELLAGLNSSEAEQLLLGYVLMRNDAYDAVSQIVREEHFSDGVHGRIFAAIGSLIGAGRSASPLTLKNTFDQDPALTGYGGGKYLIRLASASAGLASPLDYARHIADLSRRRVVIAECHEIIEDASKVDVDRPVAAVIDDAEERLFRVAERGGEAQKIVQLGQSVDATIQRVETAYKSGGLVGLQTGFIDLDRILGGLAPGNLDILASRPSMGKSALAGNIAFHAARNDKRVAIFSLEMEAEEITARILADLTGISADRQMRGDVNENDFRRIFEASESLRKLPIIIDPSSQIGVAQIRQRARRARRRGGLDLIIVDHLQIMRQGTRQEARRLEIGEITGGLKALAKELGIPILLLSQLNRSLESREDKRPILADLRESGDIEQDADVVMFLHREEYYLARQQPKRRPEESEENFASRIAGWHDRLEENEGIAEIIVAKNRQGRIGTVQLRFNGERSRFENLVRGARG